MTSEAMGLIILAVAVGVVLLSVVAAVWLTRGQRILRRRGVTTTALVVSVRSEYVDMGPEGGRTRRFAEFEFVDGTGTTRRYEKERVWDEGDVVDIVYDPRDPSRFEVTTPRKSASMRDLRHFEGRRFKVLRYVLNCAVWSMAVLLLVGALLYGLALATGVLE